LNRLNRGITLVELLVVMLSLMVVMAMGFEIMNENVRAVSRGLSQNACSDRLRLLEKQLNLDLSSRHGVPKYATLEIGSATPVSATRTLLHTRILEQTEKDQVRILELTYTLEEVQGKSGRYALVRTIDPDLAPGKSPQAESKAVFHWDSPNRSCGRHPRVRI